MLTYLLAITVGFGSFSLYMAAFFFPEVHRRYDLIWSGVGLFYALVLWVCAGRITGGLLLGQIASVALLGWFGWQTLQLRLVQTPIAQRTQLPESADSAAAIAQTTIRQLRESLSQNADRSSIGAALSQAIQRLEASWSNFKSSMRALATTTFKHSELDATSEAAADRLKNSASSTASSASSSDTLEPRVRQSVDANADLADDLTTLAIDDPSAEWSELEDESHPELDTIDGAMLEPHRLNSINPNHNAKPSSSDHN